MPPAACHNWPLCNHSLCVCALPQRGLLSDTLCPPPPAMNGPCRPERRSSDTLLSACSNCPAQSYGQQQLALERCAFWTAPLPSWAGGTTLCECAARPARAPSPNDVVTACVYSCAACSCAATAALDGCIQARVTCVTNCSRSLPLLHFCGCLASACIVCSESAATRGSSGSQAGTRQPIQPVLLLPPKPTTADKQPRAQAKQHPAIMQMACPGQQYSSTAAMR